MFDREVTVYVCAFGATDREFWALAFERFFVQTTVTYGKGTSQGLREPVILVSHLYDSSNPDYDLAALDTLINEYKCAAEQSAVLVVWREVKGQLW